MVTILEAALRIKDLSAEIGNLKRDQRYDRKRRDLRLRRNEIERELVELNHDERAAETAHDLDLLHDRRIEAAVDIVTEVAPALLDSLGPAFVAGFAGGEDGPGEEVDLESPLRGGT